MFPTVHLRLQDEAYASELLRCLQADPAFADCEIIHGPRKDSQPDRPGTVHVVDTMHLQLLPHPLSDPGKTVLISSGSDIISEAWEKGIVSVLKNSESLEYVKLAILAAILRPAKSRNLPFRRK